VDRLTAKGVSLRILGMGLDSATAKGRLMLNVLGSVAQFEREVMLERQREGVAKAKSEGKFKGRAPTARRKADEVRAMAEGVGQPSGLCSPQRVQVGERGRKLRVLTQAHPHQKL
jgi:DNA invertase Pin-like site-specific DNA recombinase